MAAAAILAVLCVCGLAAPAAARAERVGDVDVTVLPVPVRTRGSGSTSHGYLEHRCQVKNRGETPKRVRLQYPADPDDRRGQGVVTVTRQIEVPPGEAVLISLPMPPMDCRWAKLGIQVEGESVPAQIPIDNEHRLGNADPAILYSQPVDSRTIDALAEVPGAVVSGAAVARPVADRTFFRSQLPVEQWSSNWLGYSCYGAVLVTPGDVERMPAEVRAALRRYVQCGGTLWIDGPRVPAAFAMGRPDERTHYGGFGVVRTADQVIGEVRSGAFPEIARFPGASPPGDCLVREPPVPVRGLLTIAILFAVGIGPVNVLLLTWRKRRIWLWWNVPAISLATCLAVFLYATFSEGWTAQEKVLSLTVLDQAAHQATTAGYHSYYCPIAPGRLQFGAETEVAPLDELESPWDRRYGGPRYGRRPARSERPSRVLDWTDQQRLGRGWVRSRVATNFQFRKTETRRERLTVEPRGDGKLAVVNALGTTITKLYLADAEGNVYVGRDIAAGAEKVLERSGGLPGKSRVRGSAVTSADASAREPPGPTPFGELIRQQSSPGWSAWIDRGDVASRLAPNTYLAYLDRSPFVDVPLPKAATSHPLAVVYGTFKEPGDGR